MPWKIEKEGDKFKVVEAEGGPHPGKVFGTHPTEAKAKKQLAALYANEPQRTKKTMVYRYAEVDKDSIDGEKKTLQVAFSSEYPVERTFTPEQEEMGLGQAGDSYLEVLSHDEGDADFSALNRAGAFLDEHNPHMHLGKVARAEISQDRKGRAVLHFDHATSLSKARYEQMTKGSRPHISFGYSHTAHLGETQLEDGRTAHRFAFAADEISSVARPADPTVGAKRFDDTCHCTGCGRSYREDDLDDDYRCDNCGPAAAESPEEELKEPVQETLEQEMAESKTKGMVKSKTVDSKEFLTKLETNLKPTIMAEIIDETKVRADEASKFASRAKTITDTTDEFVRQHGKMNGGKLADAIRGLANQALTSDMSIAEFKTRCLTEVVGAKPASPTMIEDVTDAAGAQNYSMLRGIQSCIKRDSNVPDGLEGEVHAEILNRSKTYGGLGYDFKGFQVPQNAPMRVSAGRSGRSSMSRDMQATVFPSGGAFVPNQLMVPVIELLRNRMVLDRVGVRTMAGLQGNVIIPRQEAAATAYTVSEIGLLTASQQILGQIAMAPKRVGATQVYSKQFLMQSTPDAEAFMRDDLFKVIALKWDALGLNGQGAGSEPLGVLNTPGIGVVALGSATPTYKQIVAFETAIRAANVTDPIHYLTTPTVKGSLKTTAAALTGATIISGPLNSIWQPGVDGDGEMNGYPALASNQIPNNLIIAGSWTHLIHALWGGMDVVVDLYTKAANAEIALTINTWGDFAVRHPQAFVVSDGPGNL